MNNILTFSYYHFILISGVLSQINIQFYKKQINLYLKIFQLKLCSALEITRANNGVKMLYKQQNR